MTLVFLAATGASIARPAASRADVPPAPDSARIAAIRTVLLVFGDVRVGTASGKVSSHRVSLSYDGLELGSNTDAWRWGVTTLGSPPQARLVPWAEIESIQVRKSASGAGPLLGGVLGGAIGLMVVLAEAQAAVFTFSGRDVGGEPIVVGMVAGATLGWLIDRPGPWQSVYP